MILITDLKKQLQAIEEEIKRLNSMDDPDVEVLQLYVDRVVKIAEQMAVVEYAENCYIATLDELCKN